MRGHVAHIMTGRQNVTPCPQARILPLDHRHTAIHMDGLAGDIVGFGTGEIDHGGGNVVARAQIAGRNFRQDGRLLVVGQLDGV